MTTEDDIAFEDAFSLLGNEIRADIVRSLGDAHLEKGDSASLSFSDLHSRVSEDLPSSQFNYHLQKLVGRFVEDTDDGYRLRPVGVNLYRVIRAGTFTREVSMGPVELEVDCHSCGGGVVASYDDGRFAIGCRDCGRLFNRVSMPPSAVDDVDTGTLLARVDQYSRHELLASSQGVCHFCVNELDTAIRPASDTHWGSTDGIDVVVSRHCGHCGYHHDTSVGVALLYEPTLISFCSEHGVDVLQTPIWELEFAMTDDGVTVASTDPWRIAFRHTIDGDTLELVVDGDLAVLETTRIETEQMES
ncbi:MAG: ArsR family transcriptional regulator [Halanaeroarchaeum sp.]